MSAEDLKFLSDPDPHVRDAAWWKIQFDWRHERLEEEEREEAERISNNIPGSWRWAYVNHEPSYSWVYRDLPKESSSWWPWFAVGIFVGVLIVSLFFGVLAAKDAAPAPISNPSSCADRLG